MLQGTIAGRTKNRLLHLFFTLLLATGNAFAAPLANAQDLRDGAVAGGTPGAAPSVSIQAVVPIDGGWFEFGFGMTGSWATGCSPADPAGPFCMPSSGGNSSFAPPPPWTFTAPTGGAALTVTDAFLYGGRFEVFDFGVSIGATPEVTASNATCGDDPEVCLLDPLSSHAVFVLPAGAHEITIKTLFSNVGAGAAYFRVASIPNEGCGPGYWKTHPASWPPTGYSVSQSVVSVFSAASAFAELADQTLLQALEGGGGKGTIGSARILLRAAVAAVLNASDPDVDYPRTVASVISDVNDALASDDRDAMLTLAVALDEDNNGEGGCPLD